MTKPGLFPGSAWHRLGFRPYHAAALDTSRMNRTDFHLRCIAIRGRAMRALDRSAELVAASEALLDHAAVLRQEAAQAAARARRASLRTELPSPL
jgi:hypothetical protein